MKPYYCIAGLVLCLLIEGLIAAWYCYAYERTRRHLRALRRKNAKLQNNVDFWRSRSFGMLAHLGDAALGETLTGENADASLPAN